MVSIITPAYNAGKYIAATVASVISQSYHDWELLLVDDGSTDSTSAICDELAASDSRIRVFHRPNSGPASARNFALDKARGQYIAFLDADDILHPCFLDRLLRVATLTGAPIVITPCVSFTRVPPFSSCPSFNLSEVLLLSPSEALIKAFYQTPVPGTEFILDNAPWGKLYRRELWEKLRFAPGIWYEDMDIFYRLWLLADKIALLPVPLIGYRQHSESCMHTLSPRRFDSLDVTDRMIRWLRESHDPRITPELLRAAEVRRFAARCNILTLLYTAPPEAPIALSDKERASSSDISFREVEKRCWDIVKAGRLRVFADSRARRRDRLGAMVALFGRPAFRLVSRLCKKP